MSWVRIISTKYHHITCILSFQRGKNVSPLPILLFVISYCPFPICGQIKPLINKLLLSDHALTKPGIQGCYPFNGEELTLKLRAVHMGPSYSLTPGHIFVLLCLLKRPLPTKTTPLSCPLIIGHWCFCMDTYFSEEVLLVHDSSLFLWERCCHGSMWSGERSVTRSFFLI